jgi:hypothetical protein
MPTPEFRNLFETFRLCRRRERGLFAQSPKIHDQALILHRSIIATLNFKALTPKIPLLDRQNSRKIVPPPNGKKPTSP